MNPSPIRSTPGASASPNPPSSDVSSIKVQSVASSPPPVGGTATSTPLFPKEVVDSIVAALDGLDFGSVEITVHHGRVVQIERHQRIRFANEAAASKPALPAPRKTP